MTTDPKDGANSIAQHLNFKDEFRRVIEESHRRQKRKTKGPLWSWVGTLTAHGCGYSTAICREFGWDPYADARKPLPARS